MLFGAGIDIIFFGPFEPLTYYLAPRPGAYEAGSIDAITGAMAQAALHWGVNAWAIYAVVGLAVIALLTMGTIASAVSGVARGIRRLSNINTALAIEPIDAASGYATGGEFGFTADDARSGTRGATRTATSSTTTTAPPARRGRGAARPRPTPRTGSMRGPDPHPCAHPRGAPG